MPTTAWSTMRQDILRPLGLITGSTTTNISNGNVNVLDTKLTKRFPVDDYFNNRWYVHLTTTSGDNAGDIRRVTDYAQSSGTITGGGANWAAYESGEINFELSTFHPDDVKDARGKARGNHHRTGKDD